MLKNIAIILGLTISGVIPCVAADPVRISSENLAINSFDVDQVANLAYPVCSLNQAGNHKEGIYNYAEGDICPGSGECTYSAIMNLNGKLTILKLISSDNDAEVFKNNNMTIIAKYTFINKEQDREDGDVNAVITIKTKNGEKQLHMSGYCGI